MQSKTTILRALKRFFGVSNPEKTPIERLNPKLSPVALPGPFDYAVALTSYTQDDFHTLADIGALVRRMKVKSSREAADLLVSFLDDYLGSNPLPYNPDLVVTVPDSISNRPFSPTAYIAEKLGSRFGCPVRNDIIVLLRLEKPQKDRSFEERLEETRPRYAIRNGDTVRDRHILLFDDIYASGQSLNEAGKLIRDYGPKFLMALAMVRLHS